MIKDCMKKVIAVNLHQTVKVSSVIILFYWYYAVASKIFEDILHELSPEVNFILKPIQTCIHTLL